MAGPASSSAGNPETQKASLTNRPILSPERNALVRSLAATDKRVRDKGLSALTTWLRAKKDVQDDELRKIWKGLFYCFWHADKAAVQADLAESMAAMLQSLETVTSLRFFDVFLATMGREWPGIDRLRLDKFCLLVRSFLASMFALLSAHKWKGSLVSQFMETLKCTVLLGEERLSALGLKLHLTDIYLEELWKVNSDRKLQMFPLLEPFYVCLQKSSDKRLLDRLRRAVFTNLIQKTLSLTNKSQEESSEAEATDLDKFICVEDLQKVGPFLFSIAGAPETPIGNRKVLYAVCEEFKVLERLQPKGNGDGKRKGNGEGEREEDVKVIKEGKKVKANGNKSEKRTKSKGSEVTEAVSVYALENEGVSGTLQVKGKTEGKKPRKVRENGNADRGASKKDEEKGLFLNNGGPVEAVTVTNEASNELSDFPEPNGRVEDEKLVEKSKKRKGGEILQKSKKAGKTLKSKTEEDGANEDIQGGSNSGKAAHLELEAVLVTNTESPSLGSSEVSEFQLGKEQSESVVTKLDTLFKTMKDSGKVGNNALKKREKRKATVAAGSEIMVEESQNKPVVENILKTPTGVDNDDSTPQKRQRKVRFSLKSNLVFHKNGPVPPPSIRTPPSATPRGSALKSGTSPGPINSKHLNDLMAKPKRLPLKGTPYKIQRKRPKQTSPQA